MKRLLAIPTVLLFLYVHGIGLGDFNIFQQRKIIVGLFENSGIAHYNYLRQSIRDSLYLSLLSIPFITLSDGERRFLRELAETEAYSELFSEAEQTIVYRLEPVVQKAPLDHEDYAVAGYPLIISGDYSVIPSEEDGERIIMNLDVYNSMTRSIHSQSHIEGNLSDYTEQPSAFFFPFFKDFLTYKTLRATFTTDPPDSLIFIDERMVGTGTARGILLIPGFHRVVVRREEYMEYSDLLQISKDDYSKHIVLQKEEKRASYRISTNVEKIRVYLDERYVGETPLLFSVGPRNKTLTLSMEGYGTRSIAVQDLPPEGGDLYFELIRLGIEKELLQKAERYKRRAKFMSWTGLGVIGMAILFGTLSTLNQQRADLNEDSNPERADEAQRRAALYSTLTISSLALAGGILTFSFIETVKYFNIYSERTEQQVPIVKKEVAF